jgi:hypothetical protein
MMMLRFDDAIGGGGAASECACDAGAANGARGGGGTALEKSKGRMVVGFFGRGNRKKRG